MLGLCAEGQGGARDMGSRLAPARPTTAGLMGTSRRSRRAGEQTCVLDSINNKP